MSRTAVIPRVQGSKLVEPDRLAVVRPATCYGRSGSRHGPVRARGGWPSRSMGGGAGHAVGRLGPSSRPGSLVATALPFRKGPSSRGPCCPSAVSCRHRCAAAAWCWRAMPPTPSHPPAPRGSTRARRCPRPGRDHRAALVQQDLDVLDEYTDRALACVRKAQHFSYWMTTMLHCAEDGSDFDELRQLGELTSLVSSEAGLTYLAEGDTGWPPS